MFKVIKNRVVVIPLQDPERHGLIWIPDIGRKRIDQGIVKYIGPDVKDVRPGDLVLFSGYSGQLVRIKSSVDDKSQEVIILEEDFIVGILEFNKQSRQVNGLYLKDEEGYFPAPLDVAIQFIADSVDQDTKTEVTSHVKEFGRGT